MAEFVFQMIKARKSYGDRVILDDVTLSFLPGAKIGVVGPNGMGKSTLLKIMAGLETVSNGEASLTPGFTVGILQQEPPLDDTKLEFRSPGGPLCSRNRRWTTPRPWARTSRWRSARLPRRSPDSMKSVRRWPIRTPTSTP